MPYTPPPPGPADRAIAGHLGKVLPESPTLQVGLTALPLLDALGDLGVRSRASASCSSDGIWLDRTGARSVFIPAADVVRLRLDRGVASTVRAKDSVIVVTWRLGDATIDTGFRADDTPGHRAVLDGLAAVLGLSPAPTDLQEQNSTGQENGESGPA